ncbi:calcium-binding protein, partial [Paracoccus methylarcula]
HDVFNGGTGYDEIIVYGDIAVSNYRLTSANVSGIEALYFQSGDTISGTSGADIFDFSGISDFAGYYNGISLGGGNDRYTGSSDRDVVYGGDGSDTLIGRAGADELDGGSGRDVASYAQSGSAVKIDLGTGSAVGGHAEGDELTSIENLVGSSKNDRLIGDGANNDIRGLAGSDVIKGGSGADTLRGDYGADILEGGAGSDLLHGGGGIDTLSYVTSNSGVSVNLGTDAVSGGHASGDSIRDFENLFGSSYNDRLVGDQSANIIKGGGGADLIFGKDGEDRLLGGYGHDKISGDDNDDRLFGESGNDTLSGGGGADMLFGQSGEDRLLGGYGHDKISGGVDDDRLFGENGNDTLTGGAGKDLFVFKPNDGDDVIRDFNRHNGEDIDLRAVKEIENFRDLMNNHLESVNGNAVITYGDNSITLLGVDIDDIGYAKDYSAYDFIF